jgi:hypothetical protein
VLRAEVPDWLEAVLWASTDLLDQQIDHRTVPDEGVLHADEALAHVAARGLFVLERQMESDFRVYGSSGDELGDFLAEADAHSNQACEDACDAFTSELFARVDRNMAGQAGAAEVAYHERARITRLRPVIM